MYSSRTVTRIAIALVVILLAGLAGWYFFLRGEQSALQNLAAGRGFSGNIPSFTGIGGSTLENIVSGLGFLSTGPSADTSPDRLWKVSSAPVAGFRFLGTATSSTLYFMERATGYVFLADLKNGETKRLTNTLISEVYDAQFSRDGYIVGATLDEQGDKKTFSALINATSSSGTLSGLEETALGENVLQSIPRIRAQGLFSLVRDGSGSAIIRSDWNGTRPQRVFASNLQDWRMYVSRNGSVVLSQKAASGISGSAYRVDTNGLLIPLVRNVPGLTVLPHPTTNAFLFGSDNEVLTLTAQNGGTSSPALSLRTVADKCAWAPGPRLVAYCAVPSSISSTQFLDSWYRGLVHTSDSLWRVDVENGDVQQLLNPESGGNTLDVESPAVDDTGEYLAFMNARDRSLWVLRIAE